MQIGQSQPIRKPIPLTPLVDIVFLLLLFFMLSSTFTKFGELGLSQQDRVQAGSGVPKFPGVLILVAGKDTVVVNGQSMALAALPARLNDLAAKGAKRAALRVAPSATVQDLVSALEQAQASTLADIKVAE